MEELTQGDFIALRAGARTQAETAAAFMAHAAVAELPAAKFLLVRAAFRRQTAEGDPSAAAAMYDSIRAEHGTEYAQAVARFSTQMLSKMVSAKAPGAKEFLAFLAETEHRVRNVESARSQLAQSRQDIFLQDRLGMTLAVIGDWQSALEAFAHGGGKARDAAVFERKYPRTGLSSLSSADIADIWWNLTDGSNPDETAAMRRHAASWYRRAIDNGAARGFRKTTAERRIAEVEKAGDIPTALQRVNAALAATADDAHVLTPQENAAEHDVGTTPKDGD